MHKFFNLLLNFDYFHNYFHIFTIKNSTISKNNLVTLLKGWYSTEGASATTNSLSTSGGQGGAGAGANIKSFGEAKKENVGLNDKPDYYSNTARVTMITKDKALYQGCPNMNDGKSCNKKVQDQGDGTYRCEKCSSSSPTFNWRMIINMAMADATDT